MERFKKIVHRLLHLHWSVCIPLAFLSAAALVWVFFHGYEESPVAYPIYVLSAYTLTVLCMVLIPAILRSCRASKEKKAAAPQTAAEEKVRRSHYRNLTINLIYAFLKLGAGFYYQSNWFCSTGLYYMVLALIHFVLVRIERRLNLSENETEKVYRAWNGYQICGFLLLALNLTMTGLAFQMIWEGRGHHYPGLLVYAVAAYTFYRLILAIIRVVQCRKNNSPLLGAARNIDMTAALMSLFGLQTALFDAFGNDFAQQLLMNALTGGFVCLSTVLGALGMIFHARKKKLER